MFCQSGAFQLAINVPTPKGVGVYSRKGYYQNVVIYQGNYRRGLCQMNSNLGVRGFAILIALVFLIADCSSAASALAPDNQENFHETHSLTHVEPILIDGLPPLMCGEDLCDRPLRMNLRGDMPAAEKDGWWLAYGPDLDWNGMDVRLQRVIGGFCSISPT